MRVCIHSYMHYFKVQNTQQFVCFYRLRIVFLQRADHTNLSGVSSEVRRILGSAKYQEIKVEKKTREIDVRKVRRVHGKYAREKTCTRRVEEGTAHARTVLKGDVFSKNLPAPSRVAISYITYSDASRRIRNALEKTGKESCAAARDRSGRGGEVVVRGTGVADTNRVERAVNNRPTYPRHLMHLASRVVDARANREIRRDDYRKRAGGKKRPHAICSGDGSPRRGVAYTSYTGHGRGTGYV